MDDYGQLLVNAARWRAEEVERNPRSQNEIVHLENCARNWLEHLNALRAIDQKETEA